MNQYFNQSNVEAHYTTTAPEIWEQTEGRLDAFVASIGTGGTITGVARYLKERNPRIKVWAADPYGSVLKVYKDTGRLTKGHPYLVEGIGEDIIPGILDLDLVDEIVNVNDEDSFHYSRLLAQREGIFAGGSAGTIMKVALEVAAALAPDQVVVTIIPDTGERYLSKHHSDEWLRDKRMLRRETVTLQALNQNKDGKIPSLVSVASTQSVRETLARMSELNISQMPVLEGHRNVGSLRESALLAAALEEEAFLDRAVTDVMEDPFPTVDEHTSVAHSTPLLLKHQGLVLTSNDIPVGFITRHDVINFSEAK